MKVGAVGIRRVDIIRIEAPHVAFRRVGSRRTRRVHRVRGGEEDAVIAGEEVAARRLSDASRYTPHVRAVDVHDILLIARAAVTSRLKDETSAVVAEIRFGVLAAEGELSNVAEVRLVSWSGGRSAA